MLEIVVYSKNQVVLIVLAYGRIRVSMNVNQAGSCTIHVIFLVIQKGNIGYIASKDLCIREISLKARCFVK